MALSFMTLAALTLGAAAHRGAPGLLLPAAALFAIAGLVWRHARRRLGDLSLMPTVRATVLLTIATGAAALIATVLVLLQTA
jgi:lipopolysaccharide export LptBFGC system permease protein LptF